MKLTNKDLSLDNQMLQLLRAVDTGVRAFSPDDATPESLTEFQNTVKLLRMLEGRRYITEIFGLNLLSSTGLSKIDKVRLRGGLTDKGRAVLEYYDGSSDLRMHG